MVYHGTLLQLRMRWSEHLIETVIVLDRLWIYSKAQSIKLQRGDPSAVLKLQYLSTAG